MNAVCPGVIESEIVRRERHAGISEEELSLRVQCYPLRRLGTPEDVARAVLFLASDDSTWITGIDLFVDGGTSVQIAEPLLFPPFRRLWREASPTA